jgi:molybdopterin-guanine dinucleotide biosynthesis protein A
MIGLTPGFDVVIPRIGSQMEPLHGVYTKNCLRPMEDLIKQGKFKVTGFFDSVKVRYVEKDELDRFDPERWSFFNVNTQADLEKARRLAVKQATQRN